MSRRVGQRFLRRGLEVEDVERLGGGRAYLSRIADQGLNVSKPPVALSASQPGIGKQIRLLEMARRVLREIENERSVPAPLRASASRARGGHAR